MKKVFLSILLLMPFVTQPIPGWLKKTAAIGGLFGAGAVATMVARDRNLLGPVYHDRKKIRKDFANSVKYLVRTAPIGPKEIRFPKNQPLGAFVKVTLYGI